MKKQKEKQRRPFICEDKEGHILAFGVLYREGNVQVYWRASLGWTMEQFCSISNILSIEQGIHTLKFDVELPNEKTLSLYTK